MPLSKAKAKGYVEGRPRIVEHWQALAQEAQENLTLIKMVR